MLNIEKIHAHFKKVVGQEKYRFLHPKTTGLPVINIDKSAFFAKETPKLFGISMILTILILAVSLRSPTGVVFPLVTTVSAIVIVFGFQGFWGIVFDPSMTFILVFLSLAVSIGYSIHVFNFFKREFVKSGQRHNALLHAVEETGWPLLFSALTTIKTGLIAMIPNISPALVVGGIMGFANIPLDIMTVTIMPMLLGLAVDDTIHFINHTQLEYSRTGSYAESTRRVFSSVGVALLLTSMVLILNFSAYLASLAKVFVSMGILIPTGILAADYFVTLVLLNRFRPFPRKEPEGYAGRDDRMWPYPNLLAAVCINRAIPGH